MHNFKKSDNDMVKKDWYEQGAVDGRNPAPAGMYKTLKIMGYLP